MVAKKVVGAKEKKRELAREWRKNEKNNQEIAQLYLEVVTEMFDNGDRLIQTKKTRSHRHSEIGQASLVDNNWPYPCFGCD